MLVLCTRNQTVNGVEHGDSKQWKILLAIPIIHVVNTHIHRMLKAERSTSEDNWLGID